MDAVRARGVGPGVVYVDGITAAGTASGGMAQQAGAVFARLDAALADKGLSKHDLVDVKTTICEMGPDLLRFNQLWDAYMTGVAILPAMTACQLRAFDGGVRLSLSVTATNAPKAAPGSLGRRGGGEAEGMFTPSGEAKYEAQPMHFPWSKAVEAGGTVWLAGLLGLRAGPGSVDQAAALMDDIDANLAQAGVTPQDVVHRHVVVPDTLPDTEVAEVAALSAARYPGAAASFTHAAATCAGCKVEISCIARRA